MKNRWKGPVRHRRVSEQRMIRSTPGSHALLIAAVALVAMAAAHALTMVPDSVYHHIALGPSTELAAVLLGGSAACALRRLWHASRRDARPRPDWALPAFDAVARLGIARVISAVLAIQLAALFAGEALEQRLAGVTLAGIASLFGSTLWFAPLVHLLIGTLFGAALWASARSICAQAAALARLLRTAAMWLARGAQTAAPMRSASRPARVALAHLRPIAFFIANRPPPASIVFA